MAGAVLLGGREFEIASFVCIPPCAESAHEGAAGLWRADAGCPIPTRLYVDGWVMRARSVGSS